jgi:hypothetical protein
VLNPSSVDVDNNNTTVDPANHRHLFITLQPGLTSAVYTVDWFTTGADGHPANGSFQFTLFMPPAVGGMASLPGAAIMDDAGAGGTGRLPYEVVASAAAGAVLVLIGAWYVVRSRRTADVNS